MADITSLYTIDQVIQEAFLQQPKSQRSDEDYDRFLNFAVRGIRHLSLTTTKNSKNIIKIEPNAVNRYDFPSDMEEFIGLGVPVNGKIWWLTRNNEIIPTKTVVGLDESLDEDDGEGVELPTAQYDTYAATGGVNLQGYYTLDEKSKEIIINATIRSELLLAYVSSGVNNSQLTYIPAKYTEALIAWIFWKDIEMDKTVSEGTKIEYEKRFLRKVTDIKNIEGLSLWEWFDVWTQKSLLR